MALSPILVYGVLLSVQSFTVYNYNPAPCFENFGSPRTSVASEEQISWVALTILCHICCITEVSYLPKLRCKTTVLAVDCSHRLKTVCK